jgi:hypothetical protein
MTVHFKVAAAELVCLGIGVVCDYLINECSKIIEKRAKEESDVGELNHSRYFNLNRRSNQTANSKTPAVRRGGTCSDTYKYK